MKEKYWEELNEMFLTDEELASKHVNLAKIASLVVQNNKISGELEELQKELMELNKPEETKKNK